MILIERGDRHEIIVVGATPKLQVGDRRLTAFGERDQMVELEKPAFIAAALWPDERALP